MTYIYQVLSWFINGIEFMGTPVWPSTITIVLVVLVGFIEFVCYRLFSRWVNTNYGSLYLFYYFVFRPPRPGANREAEYARRDEVKRKYDAIYRTGK